MKIGIDAKWFFDGPPSNRIVIRNLLEELLAQNKEDFFYIFLRKSDEKNHFPYLYKNVKVIYVVTFTNALTNIFILPFYTRKLALDIVLFQNFPSPFCKSISINYIHDILFLDYPQYYTTIERIYFWPIKFLTRKCEHVITISNSEKSRLIKYNLASEEKITVVYHGVNKKFTPNYSVDEIQSLRKKLGLPEKFVLYIGRLNHRKNIATIIRALKETKNNNLVIVGKEDNQDVDLNKLISSLSLKNRVVFTGHLADSEIPLLYAMASIFCFPSFAEGFGLPPLEAMASGTPVIVSNTTAMPEICGDACLYFDPKNTKELASQIKKLTKDEGLYSTLKEKGIERAKSFSWSEAAHKISLVFQKIIKQ